MNVILFGPPGVGKGTQSALLVDRLQMKHISTGDLFRAAIKNNTQLGQEAKKYMDQGQLVPDSVVIGMVREVLAALGSRSFILDGFPRTVPQAEALSVLLSEVGLAIDRVIFLELPLGELEERLTGRRVCKGCGSVYHVKFQPPSVSGVCDSCGGDLYQRTDDMAEVIKNRLLAYVKETAPLKEYYAKQGSLVEVSGNGEADEVYRRIEKVF